MGLRCLLGHDFGEPETERERNEEGNEVVVTVREVKTCERCGEKQVVSENKEITSIDQLRESATGGQPQAEQSTTTGASASTGDEWGTDDLSAGRTDETDEPTTADAPSTDSTATDSTGSDATSADAASTDEGSETVEPEEDPIERGVADIIEQAEKDDDMLQQPPAEADEGEESTTPADDADGTGADETESEDDVPIHPGQRSAAAEESEDPDPESDDGVILDDEESSPPEEGRRQWEEEASPEEVPGQDLSVGESAESEPEPEPPGDDAEILDASHETTPSESTPRSESDTESTAPETDAAEESSTPSAVESEDAEIMGAGAEPSESEPEETEASPEPSTEPEPSDASSGREETDEGHMPWPEAPGEDEGHDASPPDGEPAEVDLSGGLAPEGETDSSETTADNAEPTADDQANGHRTESGESGDASTAPNANVDLQQSSRDAQLEYYCPECGLTRDVGNSSMRAGDICPECRVGYITEQQKAE